MWTYILRRLLLMIPTLFGVTVVSFCIMQLAPGDPLLSKAGNSGMTGQTSQTRDAYLNQKRDLKLDKPLLLNFNYFRDYSAAVPAAAYFMARSDQEVAKEMPALAGGQGEWAARRAFLETLRIPDFQPRLADAEQHAALAQAIQSYVKVFCEDTGLHGVPAAIGILRDARTERRERIGAIRSLNNMVVDPFLYTYSQHPAAAETPAVVSTWETWWQRAGTTFPPLPAARRDIVAREFAAVVAEPSRGKAQEALRHFEIGDVPFFMEKLLDKTTTLGEKAAAAMALRQCAGTPLATDVPADAKPKLVQRVGENWLAWYDARQVQFHPGLLKKSWYIVADTQYAHMVGRLATFHFGRSAVRTREPVSEKVWAAVLVSAPLMILSELMIYLVAVPLGIVCAVNRNGWLDRGISLGLFLLYSVPPFVAGMLFLLFLCYGDYLKLFPMLGLHAEGAGHLGPLAYALDYLHHIFLPVTCLSLFSLAGMAMYSRGSMLDVIGQDYIRTARAKGLSRSQVIFKHAFRNALIPIITLFSNFLPAMLGGSVLIEVLFGIPGMGRLSFDSIDLKDYPTLMAMIYIDALMVMISILLADLLYVLADPRISFQGQGQSA